MVVDKEQQMKFFISNKTETGNKFGKWHYFADSRCKVIKINGIMYDQLRTRGRLKFNRGSSIEDHNFETSELIDPRQN